MVVTSVLQVCVTVCRSHERLSVLGVPVLSSFTLSSLALRQANQALWQPGKSRRIILLSLTFAFILTALFSFFYKFFAYFLFFFCVKFFVSKKQLTLVPQAYRNISDEQRRCSVGRQRSGSLRRCCKQGCICVQSLFAFRLYVCVYVHRYDHLCTLHFVLIVLWWVKKLNIKGKSCRQRFLRIKVTKNKRKNTKTEKTIL